MDENSSNSYPNSGSASNPLPPTDPSSEPNLSSQSNFSQPTEHQPIQPNPWSPQNNPSGQLPEYQPEQSSAITDFHSTPIPSPNEPYTPSPASLMINPPTATQSPKPRRSHKKALIIFLVLILLLLSAGAAFAYKFYYLDALTAPRDLFTSSIGDKSGKFKLTALINASDSSFGSAFTKITTSASGSYDSSDPKNPKLDVTIDGGLGISKFAGEILNTDSTVYLKITKFDFLAALGFKIDNSWYKFPASVTDPIESTNKKCDYSTLQDPGSLADKITGQNIPLKNAIRVGLFETIDGHQTSHFKGALDNSKLTTYISEANKSLSADCQLDIRYDDYKDLTITYDIWIGTDFDRLKANLYDSKDKTSIDLTLDLFGFDKPVTITAPKDAKDINSLIPTGSLFDSPASSSLPTF